MPPAAQSSPYVTWLFVDLFPCCCLQLHICCTKAKMCLSVVYCTFIVKRFSVISEIFCSISSSLHTCWHCNSKESRGSLVKLSPGCVRCRSSCFHVEVKLSPCGREGDIFKGLKTITKTTFASGQILVQFSGGDESETQQEALASFFPIYRKWNESWGTTVWGGWIFLLPAVQNMSAVDNNYYTKSYLDSASDTSCLMRRWPPRSQQSIILCCFFHFSLYTAENTVWWNF